MSENITAQQHRTSLIFPFIGWILVIGGLYLASLYNYLLFHGLAELFSIVVAFAIFILAWNTRRLLDNHYLLFVGIAYLFVGCIDLVHTFAYKGMNIFQGFDANLPTQLWIIARYMESISLLIAPFFIIRKVKVPIVFAIYSLSTLFILLLLFLWKVFPDCFIEGMGLTTFKLVSEYVISLILVVSIILLLSHKRAFTKHVLYLIIWSIVFTIGSELAFTFYISVYGFSNLMGHYLKIISFYLIYKALIKTVLEEPYSFILWDLKQNVKILQKERNTTRRYLDIAGVMIVVIDVWQTIHMINKKGCEILGYTEKEIIGKNWFDNVIPDRLRRESKTVFNKLLDGEVEAAKDYENSVMTSKGEERIISWHNTILKDDEENITGILCSGEDVTELKQVEKLLQESEEHYRTLTEKSMVGVYLVRDNLFRYVNNAFAQIHGHTPDEIINKLGPIDLVLPEDRVFVTERIKSRISGEIESDHFEFRIARKDGVIRHVEVFGSRSIYQGNPAILGTLIDITDKKKAEAQLLNEKQRFLTLVEDAPFGMVMIDKNGTFTYLNPKFEALFGYNLADVPDGETWFRKAYPDTNYRGNVISTWVNDVDELKPGEQEPRVFSVTCKDGTEKIINFIAVQLDTGETLISCEDITERKQLEKKLHALSITDELTGLYNRRGFLTFTQQPLKLAERTKREMLLFFADLDRMKWINDTFGHQEGDNALIEVAMILKETFRESDIIGRMGGDEFAVLATEVSKSTPRILKERLRNCIDSRNRLTARHYKLSLSIGLVQYNPENPCSVDELIARADALMYEEKRRKQGVNV